MPDTNDADSPDWKVIDAIKSVLQLDDIGEDDNFFELGGDSLMVIELAATLEEALGFEVPLEVVLDAVTTADILRSVRLLVGQSSGRPA